MELSKRLKTVADELKYRTVADIGTDHAYIPIYLLQNNLIDKAYACDINSAPLDKARKNINKYGFNDKIKLRLGNGLSAIKPFEAETAIISGMGGMLIIDILKSEVTNSFKQLILQPQIDIYSVRKYLHKIGFKIENEEMIFEYSKYYTIINAVKGKEIYNNEYDYIFGKKLIDKKNSILKQYITCIIEKQNNIIFQLKEIPTYNAKQKLEVIKKENILYKEVLKCL